MLRLTDIDAQFNIVLGSLQNSENFFPDHEQALSLSNAAYSCMIAQTVLALSGALEEF